MGCTTLLATAARTAEDFWQFFVPFQIELANTNARLNPSRDRHKRRTDKPSPAALPQLLPTSSSTEFFPSFSLFSPKEERLGVARLPLGQLLFHP